MKGSGSENPSLLDSRGSAQGILDVSNLWRPGTEEEKLRMKCWVFCAEQETSRERDEMKRQFWSHNQVNLEPQTWYKE